MLGTPPTIASSRPVVRLTWISVEGRSCRVRNALGLPALATASRLPLGREETRQQQQRPPILHRPQRRRRLLGTGRRKLLCKKNSNVGCSVRCATFHLPCSTKTVSLWDCSIFGARITEEEEMVVVGVAATPSAATPSAVITATATATNRRMLLPRGSPPHHPRPRFGRRPCSRMPRRSLARTVAVRDQCTITKQCPVPAILSRTICSGP